MITPVPAPETVALQISVDPAIADEIRVYLAKTQLEPAASAHPRVIEFLHSIAPQIANAASYSRQIKHGLQRSVEQQREGA